MKLTDITIKTLKRPATGAIIYADDTLTGFGVRVSEGGTKAFVLTHGIQRKRETIGRVGVIGLADARKAAKLILAEKTLGKLTPRTTAWRTALDLYLAEVKRTRKERTHDDYERLLNKHFRFGDTKLADITQLDIDQKLDRLIDTHAEHFHAYVVVNTFLRWAHRKNYLATNPMERMKAPQPNRARERVLTDSELRKVWNASADDAFGRIVRLLILTGQRRSEVQKFIVDRDTITLPAEATKNGRLHTFPIGRLAQKQLPIPPFNGWSKSKAKLDKACGVRDWTLHDLRRTYATGLASLAVPLPVIEKLLNHISGSFAGIVGVYQRYNFQPEMREAVDKWERHIQTLTA